MQQITEQNAVIAGRSDPNDNCLSKEIQMTFELEKSQREVEICHRQPG